jgi:hypothetical protein
LNGNRRAAAYDNSADANRHRFTARRKQFAFVRLAAA